jgi:hypothetical protein
VNKSEILLVKMKVTPDMIGTTCLMPTIRTDTYDKIIDGEYLNCRLKKIPDKRSYGQLGLFWKACDVVAKNSDDQDWNTKEKVSEQIKITLKFIHSKQIFCFKYVDKTTGELKEMLQFPTKSIAFDKLKHLEACDFFNKAFAIMANRVNMEVEEFLNFVMEKS